MVVQDGDKSKIENMCVGVRQCFVLGPVLFVIEVNDFSFNLQNRSLS